MKRLLALLVISGVVTVGAAGCGKTAAPPLSKQQYIAQLNAINAPVSESVTALTNATTTEAAAAFTQLQADLRVAASKMAQLTPPAAVASAHKQLEDGFSDLANELDPIIKQAAAGDANGAAAAFNSAKGIAEQSAAQSAMKAAGY